MAYTLVSVFADETPVQELARELRAFVGCMDAGLLRRLEETTTYILLAHVVITRWEREERWYHLSSMGLMVGIRSADVPFPHHYAKLRAESPLPWERVYRPTYEETAAAIMYASGEHGLFYIMERLGKTVAQLRQGEYSRS